MNTSPVPPLTNPSPFTFVQQIPDYNPNFLQPQNPMPPSSSSPPDLPTTLSTLQSLLHLCHSTLSSLPSNLSLKDPVLTSCPFNTHHRMLPQSLFRHSLHCPSRIDLELDLQSLRYPHTLTLSPQSQQHQQQQYYSNGEELCLSLTDHVGGLGDSNFFYRDCPGVVSSFSSHDQDNAEKWMFTLPAVLSVECANVIGRNEDIEISKRFDLRILETKLLASDFLGIKRELDMWSDYPHFYSFVVLKAIGICRRLGYEQNDLKRWVIVNSPCYGVVIDDAMRDHILLLFKLSLKAIVREAVGLKEVNEQSSKINLRNMRFSCPVLVQSLKWLANQLSLLYGETNGKYFAINMFKQCITSLALGSLLTPIEQKEITSADPIEVTQKLSENDMKIEGANIEYPIEKNNEHELGECDNGSDIYVYQVAAAVASLHERALLEEKIKSLRRSQPIPKYQILTDHACMSKRAEEVRQKRCNYRSILEHDGFTLQRSYNQETNKTKTREELLAEERDYKRRRMSYHGKKKRSSTQVSRDIINEYMDEIKRAGGIGCFTKGYEEGEVLPFEPHNVNGNSSDKKINIPDSSSDYKSHQSRSVESFQYEKSSTKDHERKKQNFRGSIERHESRSISRDKHDRKYDTSSDRYRSHKRSDEQNKHRREKYDNDRRVSADVAKKNTRRRDTYRSHKSDRDVNDTFDDRYDPSETHHE